MSCKPDQTLLSQLTQMGIQKEKAEEALIATNNKGINQAVDWIYKQNNPQQEKKNEKPSTEMKKKSSEKYEPVLLSDLKLRGDSKEEKERFRKKLLEEEAARRNRERKEKQEQLKILRKRLELEKKERAERLGKTKMPVEESKKPQKTEKQTMKDITECILQIRLVDGSSIVGKFRPDATLLDVANYVVSTGKMPHRVGEFNFCTAFPRKVYTSGDFMKTSIKDAGLAPKGSIIVQKAEDKGVVKKGEGTFPGYKPPSHGGYPGYPTPMPMPMPTPTLPYEKPYPTDNSDSDDDDDIDEDEVKKNMKVLCRKWIFSAEECPEGSSIKVYRTSSYKFPKSDSTRQCITLNGDGTVVFEDMKGSDCKQTDTGKWSLNKSNPSELTIKPNNGNALKLDIATLTTEVLIVTTD